MSARRSALLFVVLLAGAACNRPAPADTPTASPEPQTLPPTVTSSPTVAPSATPTATETPAPTSTPLPEDTPTPHPTLDVEDPTGLGLDPNSPDHLDDFSERGAWFEFSGEDTATIVWEEGRLSATDNVADGFIWWSTTTTLAVDHYAQVTAEVGDCSGKDAYGMALRVGGTNFDQGYTLEVSCDGSFRIRRFISGEAPALLQNWTASEHIVQGPNATNVIGLLANGSELMPIVNGEQLLEQPLTDSEYGAGYVSLFPSASGSGGVSVYFDNFKMWFLP